jgi:hypothetical protein
VENGIYFVNFKSTMHDGMGGLVVVDSGRIHGGDTSYLYKGVYKLDGNIIKSSIQVEHYRGEQLSVFGPIKKFNLSLVGSSTGDSFELKGYLVEDPSMHFAAKGKKVSDLM